MKRFNKIACTIIILTLMTALFGCSLKQTAPAYAEPPAEDVNMVDREENSTQEIDTYTNVLDTKDNEDVAIPTPVEESTEQTAALPPYEYPGPELFYTILYQYLMDEFGPHYEPADVCIPCPIIVYMDESDNNDIKVYGNFMIYNYDLKGETLECVSGGSYPGCIHVRSTSEGYEVFEREMVEDGSGYDESSKKIFGEYYDELIKSMDDTTENERIRNQIISNYVFANDLKIKQYKDYGWNPVTLLPENIDSFYSILD